MDQQIYAPPQSPQGQVSNPRRNALCYTDGASLFIAPGYQSANKCLITGETLEETAKRKKQSLAYTPIWALLLLVLGIIGILAIVIVSKNGKAEIAFSQSVRKKYTKRKLIFIGMFLLSIAGFVGAASLSNEIIGGASGILLVISLFCLALGTRPLKVKGYKDGYFKVTNVHSSILHELMASGH